MGAFPQETLTAGAETRSKAYADLGSGIRASRSANVPDPLVGVGFQLGGAEPVERGDAPSGAGYKVLCAHAVRPYVNLYIHASKTTRFRREDQNLFLSHSTLLT